MKVVNTYQMTRENWFSWTVSIDGTPQELQRVKYVTYFLHETFPNRRISSSNRTTKFAKTMNGWGEFILKAEATMLDNTTQFAYLWLNLGFSHTQNEKIRYNGEFSSTQKEESEEFTRKDSKRKEPGRPDYL